MGLEDVISARVKSSFIPLYDVHRQINTYRNAGCLTRSGESRENSSDQQSTLLRLVMARSGWRSMKTTRCGAVTAARCAPESDGERVFR